MADNIPRELVDLPKKMELEFKNKLPYPADAKKYMLDLYKKIEKNLSLSKRAKRKISKTFKKVFTNEDPEKGSLKNENKTFINNFNYLYTFFQNDCDNKEIYEAKKKIDKISNLNKDSKNNNSEEIISKESIEIIENIGCLYSYDINKSAKVFNYKNVLIGSCNVINNNVSQLFVSIYGSKKPLNKNFKAFCDMIIEKNAPNDFKGLSIQRPYAVRKLEKIEKMYAEQKEYVDILNNFLDLDVVKNSNYEDKYQLETRHTKFKQNLLKFKNNIEHYRAILYYGETFYDKKDESMNAFIEPLIKAGNNYNKNAEFLKDYIQSPKTTSVQIKETLEKIDHQYTTIRDTAKIGSEKARLNTKNKNKNNYEQSVSSVYAKLERIKVKKIKWDDKAKNTFNKMNELIKQISYDNSWQGKITPVIKSTLKTILPTISSIILNSLTSFIMSMIV